MYYKDSLFDAFGVPLLLRVDVDVRGPGGRFSRPAVVLGYDMREMCVYIHINMFVYIYTYIYMYIYMYKNIHMCIYVYVYVHVDVDV